MDNALRNLLLVAYFIGFGMGGAASLALWWVLR